MFWVIFYYFLWCQKFNKSQGFSLNTMIRSEHVVMQRTHNFCKPGQFCVLKIFTWTHDTRLENRTIPKRAVPNKVWCVVSVTTGVFLTLFTLILQTSEWKKYHSKLYCKCGLRVFEMFLLFTCSLWNCQCQDFTAHNPFQNLTYVQLDGEPMTVKAVAFDPHHFHIHQPIQWPLVPCELIYIYDEFGCHVKSQKLIWDNSWESTRGLFVKVFLVQQDSLFKYQWALWQVGCSGFSLSVLQCAYRPWGSDLTVMNYAS